MMQMETESVSKNISKPALCVCIVSYHQHTHDERAYWKMARSLQQNNYSVVRLAIGEFDADFIDDQGIHIIQRSLPQFSKLRFVNFGLRVLFRKTRRNILRKAVLGIFADVFILHDFRSHYLASDIHSKLPNARLLYDVIDPTVQQIVDERPLPFGNRLWAAHQARSECRALPFFQHIICTEPILAQKYQSRLPSTPVSIIYNYTTLNKACTLSDEPVLYDAIYCGLLSLNRGLWQILEAAELLKQRNCKAKILLLGPLDSKIRESDLLQRIKDLELQEFVQWHQPVDFLRVESFYRQSAIGLLPFLDVPANRQLLPIKLFEYLNFGLPIVAPSFGLMGDVFAPLQAGISINTSVPEQLADAIELLLSDRELYCRFRQNGFEAGTTRFRWQSQERILFSAI